MRKLYLVILSALFSSYCYGQQDPLYSQYLTNPMIFNPAYAGLNNSFNGAVSFRQQWAGYDGAPTTVNFNAHSSFADNKAGIGAMFIKDKAGLLTNNEVELLGSYKLNFEKYTLSFGMQVGFVNSTYNYNKVFLPPNQQDPAFPDKSQKYSWPNVGAGAILKGDNFIVGLSVPRMTQVKSDSSDALLQRQTVYLYGAYVYYLGTRLRFKPSVLLRTMKGTPMAADLNFNINVDTKYSGGIFIRNFRSYGVILQAWVFDKFRFGYAFELPTNYSVGPQFTTHEITLAVKMAILNSHDKSFSEF